MSFNNSLLLTGSSSPKCRSAWKTCSGKSTSGRISCQPSSAGRKSSWITAPSERSGRRGEVAEVAPRNCKRSFECWHTWSEVMALGQSAAFWRGFPPISRPGWRVIWKARHHSSFPCKYIPNELTHGHTIILFDKLTKTPKYPKRATF